jgi:hypothetical protein
MLVAAPRVCLSALWEFDAQREEMRACVGAARVGT